MRFHRRPEWMVARLVNNGAASGFGDDWLKFAGIKIFYDGGMTLKTITAIAAITSIG
jgi:hypothetical protein